jgi:hypothetical protein
MGMVSLQNTHGLRTSSEAVPKKGTEISKIAWKVFLLTGGGAVARNVDDAVGVSRRKPCCIMELMVLETLSLAVSRKLDSATDTRQNSVEFIIRCGRFASFRKIQPYAEFVFYTFLFSRK